eukprot:3413124-Pleurochrysis_carterae.AAC.2
MIFFSDDCRRRPPLQGSTSTVELRVAEGLTPNEQDSKCATPANVQCPSSVMEGLCLDTVTANALAQTQRRKEVLKQTGGGYCAEMNAILSRTSRI